MNLRIFLIAPLLAASIMCFAVANGSWLKKVPPSYRTRVNPYAGNPDAAAAGANLFNSNCSQCHGTDANGKYSRPSLKSDRLKAATDGELAWLLKNGEPFKGMPGWGALPEQRRWQLIAFLRSMNPPDSGARQ